MLNSDLCWQAVVERNASLDGQFFYGVLTTGIFCRPGCASRAPKRENVRFYATAADAQRDGLRACLRCQSPGQERIHDLCAYIDQHVDETLSLETLAARAGLSAFHLQRTFKAIVGSSPKQYQAAKRLEKLKGSLRQRKDVTEAIYDAGYGSASRVYEKASTGLGMTPLEYRAGGRGVAITFGSAETPLGLMMIGATDRGLCFLQFGDTAAELEAALRREYPGATIEAMSTPPPAEFQTWIAALNAHLAGEQPDLRLPIAVRATAFQLKVWRYLQTIPYGSVESYAEVAAGIGAPKAARAVARACASNHIALAIPCHRVIRGTGEPGGYKWGLARKRVLLDRERALRPASSS